MKKEEIMTEKEKRDKGELYNLANDEELVLEMRKCKQLCYEYNHISPDKMEERKEFIKKILGTTGENLQVESNFYCDYGYNTHVGENFYVNHNCVILDVAKVEFGDNVFIGPKRKYYSITKKGKDVLKEKETEWKIFSNGVNKVLGGVSFAN